MAMETDARETDAIETDEGDCGAGGGKCGDLWG
jgi:hypothetical protein